MSDLKAIHADWLHTFRSLQEYTANFSEPIQGKTNGWFLDGPPVSTAWVKNAGWAKSVINRRYHAAVTAGIIYGAEFSKYQNAALELVRPEIEQCWNMCIVLDYELEKLNQPKIQ
jgi:hypothetical protein